MPSHESPHPSSLNPTLWIWFWAQPFPTQVVVGHGDAAWRPAASWDPRGVRSHPLGRVRQDPRHHRWLPLRRRGRAAPRRTWCTALSVRSCWASRWPSTTTVATREALSTETIVNAADTQALVWMLKSTAKSHYWSYSTWVVVHWACSDVTCCNVAQKTWLEDITSVHRERMQFSYFELSNSLNFDQNYIKM